MSRSAQRPPSRRARIAGRRRAGAGRRGADLGGAQAGPSASDAPGRGAEPELSSPSPSPGPRPTAEPDPATGRADGPRPTSGTGPRVRCCRSRTRWPCRSRGSGSDPRWSTSGWTRTGRWRCRATPPSPAGSPAGAAPGALGPAVIAGHVTWNGAPGGVPPPGRPAARTTRSRSPGATAGPPSSPSAGWPGSPKAQFPTQAVYGAIDHAGLRLITCGGDVRRRPAPVPGQRRRLRPADRGPRVARLTDAAQLLTTSTKGSDATPDAGSSTRSR